MVPNIVSFSQNVFFSFGNKFRHLNCLVSPLQMLLFIEERKNLGSTSKIQDGSMTKLSK